jgi:hypothetical protein
VRRSRAIRFSTDDVGYLRSRAGAAALAAVAELELTDATRVGDVAAARDRFGDRAAVLVETVLLRRRAADKLGELGVSEWLFTDEALQQATAAPVALHRARRLAGGGSGVVVHDATCSIGTELAALRVCGIAAVGSDIDPVRLSMARHNVGKSAWICRADALHPVTRDAVLVVDPARRVEGRRRLRIDEYQPALGSLLDAYRGREFVVKCAPGIDFGQVRRLGFGGEIEVTSYRGSVREACLWSAGLSRPGVGRRASVLDRGEEITDAEPDDCPVRPAGRWIVDPDGAVVRAGLVRQYGARHGLWRLDEHLAYLSGDAPPPGVRAFRVLEHGRYGEKTLRRTLAARGVGRVEILVRGLDVDPNALRPRLRLRGDAEATVVIARLATGPKAYVCAAVWDAGTDGVSADLRTP